MLLAHALLLANAGAAAVSDAPLARPLDAATAAKLCSYDDMAGRWRCDADALAHFDVTLDESVGTDGATNAVIKPVFRESDGCLVGVNVKLAPPPDAEASVDWSRVAFVVDGKAVQAVPGFARLITSNLQQRQSAIPAGATLDEHVLSVEEKCLSFHGLSPLAPQDEVVLALPLAVRGVTENIRYRRARAWIAKTELEAMTALGPPTVPSRPGKPRPDEPSKPESFPWGAVAGGTLGALGAAGVGVGTSFALPAGATDERRLICGSLCGIFWAPSLVLVGAAVGFAIDGAVGQDDQDAFLQVQLAARTLNGEWERYEHAVRARSAYDRKLEELGRPRELEAVPRTTNQYESSSN